MDTCMQSLSASEYTATVFTPSFLAVLMILQAISPLSLALIPAASSGQVEKRTGWL